MGPNGPHDMPPMGPPNMSQGPPMMQKFPQGEGTTNQAPGGLNFYDNFYQQQQSMGTEGGEGEGELVFLARNEECCHRLEKYITAKCIIPYS